MGGDDDGNGGNGDDTGGGGEDLGERVPEVEIAYWSNVGGGTSIKENILPVVTDNLEEIGVDASPRPTEFTTDVADTQSDARTRDINLYYYTPGPDRLDPNDLMDRFQATRAGNQPGMNVANWPDCEYSYYAQEQSRTPEADQRREHVIEAQRILSEEAIVTPVAPYMTLGAVRTDSVDPGGIGDAGIMLHNANFYIKSEPTERDYIQVDSSPITTETRNYLVLDSTPSLSFWNHLFTSTLAEWDEFNELQPMLAEDWTVEDDGRRVVVDLRSDAQFHNGDPITAEDVAFTYEHLWSNPGEFPMVDVPEWESIEAEDETTAVFNFEEPFAPLIEKTFHRWGILHRDTWEGATDDPGGFTPDEMIGSGPFEIVDMSTGEYISMEPADTHPIHSPDHRLEVQAYRDESTMYEAFRSGELDTLADVSFSIFRDIQDQMSDVAETAAAEGHHPFALIPQYPSVPSKFYEFRDALGKAVDRSLINEVAFHGEAYEPLQSTMYMRTHPYAPEDDEVYSFTDDPTGDVEAARQTLEDAGWGWDDSGNLRYPADADLSPVWPAGETPDLDDFACLAGDGEWAEDYEP